MNIFKDCCLFCDMICFKMKFLIFLWLNLFLLIYIVNDVNVVNYDNVVVFVIEKNLLMVDL